MNSEYLRVFKAFSDPRRVRILEILCSSEEECACVLLDDLKISQATLSHHMKILCEAGIVKSRKVGKWNYYSINEDGCDYAGTLIQNIKEKHMDGIVKILARFFRKADKITSFLSPVKEDCPPAGSCCCCEKE